MLLKADRIVNQFIIKVENIYINEYMNPKALRIGIKDYINQYNNEHPHETFEYLTPMQVYTGELAA